MAEGEGLFCYRDQMRLCNAGCMAFLPKAPAGTDYIGEQWAHCMELVNGHRTGKHLTIIANELSKHNASMARSKTAPGGG